MTVSGARGAALVLGALLAASGAQAGQRAGGAAPHVALSRAQAPPTATILVSGTGFGADEDVAISFDARRLATATADHDGSFERRVALPADAAPGAHTVSALGAAD